MRRSSRAVAVGRGHSPSASSLSTGARHDDHLLLRPGSRGAVSSQRHAGTDWPSHWKASTAKGRVPTPAPEVVAAGPLLVALFTALGDEPSPCASDPEVWTSEHPDDVLVAREGCAECPARQPCAAYGQAIGATAGTWAGHDMTPRDGRRRPTREDVPA